MSAPARRRAVTGVLLGFLLLALLVAGGLSFLASPAPDGLDTVALHGCEVSRSDGAEHLRGTCIAQGARDSALAGSPLAGYALGGRDGTVGFAGVIGVLVTLLVAGLLFGLLRRGAGRDAVGPAAATDPPDPA